MTIQRREPLASEAAKRNGEVGMAEGVDEVGDVVTKEPDEDGVLVFGIDRLTLIDRIADRQVCLRRPN